MEKLKTHITVIALGFVFGLGAYAVVNLLLWILS